MKSYNNRNNTETMVINKHEDAIARSKEKLRDSNKNRSEHNDFILIETDEHKHLLALYHAVHREKEEASPENIRSAVRALQACNLFYLG